MKTYSSKASICVQDAYHLEYRVCTISYFLNEEGGFRYVFAPNYSVIDLTSPDFFQGIPGLNLDLRKEEYVRENRTPTFISERVPQKNREDYADLLKDAGMTYMEPLLYLIKTDKFYSGDFLYLRPFAERKEVDADDLGSKLNTSSYLRKILCHLAAGDAVRIGAARIDDENRKMAFEVLIDIYARTMEAAKEKRLSGIEKAKQHHAYRGRKPKRIDLLRFTEVLKEVKEGKKTAKEGAAQLGISIDKYYRERRKLQKENDKLLQ